MPCSCPACHDSESTPFFESVAKDFSLAGYPYVRCAGCATVFNGRSPEQEELTALHRDQWYSSATFRYPDAGRESLLGHWTKTMAEAAAAVKARVPGTPRHLDIGCGYGGCCEALRQVGFNSTGVDPSPDSIAAAQREFPQNQFYTASLSDAGLPELQGTWDLVTLNDVIEHVVSPDLLMSEVGRVTGAGSLVYVQAPSAASLQLAYLREHAFHSMAPFHRTLFSLAGLTRLLDRNGFDVVSVLPSHINWGWTRALSFQLGSPAEYERLRQDAAFRALDLAIDTLFDRIAIDQGRAPS
ncbi:MAG TPA: class I SAM-dependent methyltransferase, partial [Vicinamibacterales bacterium]|nr:class I SAM-dependent methyltransferase [Vicinamibacterales bacterium]